MIDAQMDGPRRASGVHLDGPRRSYRGLLLAALGLTACAGDQAPMQSTPGVGSTPGAESTPAAPGPDMGTNQNPGQESSGPSDAGQTNNPVALDPDSTVPAADLDPDAAFDWPQTEPTGDRRCQGGTYKGTWNCNTFGIIPFDGEVTLDFVQSMDGEFLELADARLTGATAGFGFSCSLKGKLNCSTLMFSANVDMGQYGMGDANNFNPQGTFDGTLTGTLDPSTSEIQGDWALQSDAVADCKGPWTAKLTP